MTTILGSPYVPSCDGAILFCRGRRRGPLSHRPDVHAAEARRARSRGSAASSSAPAAECGPGEGFASLTLEEIFADHIKPLRMPAWFGAMIGHQTPQWTLPVGADVEIDATAGHHQMIAPAVQ